MNFTAVIVIVLIALVVLAKFYNMYKTIRTKGVKGVLTQKLIMLSIVGVIFGIVFLINPDVQFENPKEFLVEKVTKILND